MLSYITVSHNTGPYSTSHINTHRLNTPNQQRQPALTSLLKKWQTAKFKMKDISNSINICPICAHINTHILDIPLCFPEHESCIHKLNVTHVFKHLWRKLTNPYSTAHKGFGNLCLSGFPKSIIALKEHGRPMCDKVTMETASLDVCQC